MFVSYLLRLLTHFECQLKVFLPHLISFSFPDWSRAVGDESPYHGSRHECLSQMLVIDLL